MKHLNRAPQPTHFISLLIKFQVILISFTYDLRCFKKHAAIEKKKCLRFVVKLINYVDQDAQFRTFMG